MIIEIFKTQTHGLDTLPKQAEIVVPNPIPTSLVAKLPGNSFCQAQTAIHLSEQEYSAISGNISASKIGLDLTSYTGCEIDLRCGTFCQGETFLYFLPR